MSGIAGHIEAVLDDVVTLRHELHTNPELGFEERATAARIADELSRIDGMVVRTGVAETGVVGLLNGEKNGPCLALRADMDALPIVEQTGVAYASKNDGRMHACGHDGHMSCLVGAARVLNTLRDRLGGPVKFIFQPAEENDAGGRAMVEAGVLEDPTVAAAVALHGWPTMPVGHISVRGGPVMASTDSGAIVIRGVGSHGAYPHRGIDPIVVAAHIITQFQTIPARTVDPLDSAVITVGSVHGGTICNVIPPECRMELTCRALNAATREHVREHVKRVAENTARSFGATADVQVKRGYPVMVNDPRLSDWVAAVGRQVLGADCVRTTDPPSMGAEDFAYYAQKVPCVMFRVGVRPPDRDTYPGLHNPGYDFNDDTLPVGIRMFSELTLRYWQDTPLAGEGL